MILHFAVILFVTCCMLKENTCLDSEVGFLLPGNIIPSHYNLRWIITDDCSDRDEFSFNKIFTGVAEITVTAIKPDVKVIEMNAKCLTFTKVSLDFGNGSSATELEPIFYKREQKVLFRLTSELPMSQPLLLNISFKGKMSDREFGMFIGRQSNGKNVIGTLLEPAYARQTYPCFDEPEYKASFTISIDLSQCVLGKGYTAYSNSPLEKIEKLDDRAIIHFEKTNVVMSTYLMTIGIAPYVSTPNKQFNSSYPDASKTEWKDMKTWGTSDFVDSDIGRVVQIAGVRLMEIFTSDLRIGYPLKKVDQLNIIPFGFFAGMENWGVVFYRFINEPYLSVDLVAHELAHQWFGNLVTCHWWSNLWLNEGFATYFGTYGTHKFALEHPGAQGWNPLLTAVSHTLQTALTNDVLGERALTKPIEDPLRYQSLFDSIVYAKGGSVLRMWNSVLGEEAFLKAIHEYLDERKFNVSTPEHLFKAFDSVVDMSASNFGEGLPSKYFEKWTTQEGFPLVTVVKSKDNPSEYILTQRIFKPSTNQPPANWTIPISYSTSSFNNFNKTHAMLWFKGEEHTAVIKLPKPVLWIIVNNKFTGYYRVNYDPENWKAIINVLLNPEKYRTIPIENRIQIITDVAAISRENYTSVDYDVAMDSTLYLKHETEYHPWKAALDHVLGFMDAMLSKSKAFYGYFKEYVKDLLQENYSRLRFNKRHSDSYSDKKLRVKIVKWACRMNHSDCISGSSEFLQTYLPRGNIYEDSYEEREIYDIAYCTSIRHADNDWDTLWGKYSSAMNIADKITILRGISCSNDMNIIKRLLMKSVDDTVELSRRERQVILEEVLKADPRNAEMAFDFFTKHYGYINDLYSGKINDLVIGFAERLATDEEFDKMKDFVDELKCHEQTGPIAALMEDALAITESNNVWLKEKSVEVIHWLLKRYRSKY